VVACTISKGKHHEACWDRPRPTEIDAMRCTAVHGVRWGRPQPSSRRPDKTGENQVGSRGRAATPDEYKRMVQNVALLSRARPVCAGLLSDNKE